jgi:tellurium resistance protein TerD
MKGALVMGISLVKGQTVNLEKGQYDLSQVTIGLGWDVRQAPSSGGRLGRFLGGGQTEAEYDLDAVAFLLGQDGKVKSTGDQRLVGGDVIFFNNLRHPSGNIWLTGDNRTGAGDGDDEQIIVRLDAMSQEYQKIVFVVQIYQGIKNGQHFGMVSNAFIRAVDAKGQEMARFDISGDASFNNQCSMVFAEVYRRDGGWKFRAIGEPRASDSFASVLKEYLA